MEIVGKLFEKHEATKRTETFTVREFVIEVENPRNPQYNDFILFQLSNDRCQIIDQFNEGDVLQVTFDIRGRKWTSPEGRIAFFNTLSAWRVERYTGIQQQPQQGGMYQQPTNGYQQPQQPMGYQQPQPAYGAYQQPQQPAAYQQPAYQPQPTPAPAPQPAAAPQAAEMQGIDLANNGTTDDLPF